MSDRRGTEGCVLRTAEEGLGAREHPKTLGFQGYG